MKKNKKAFTLVELIVVITILAILGTIAFISLQGYSQNARDSVRIADMSKIKTSLELFQLNAGKYPETTDATTITYSGAIVWEQGVFGEDTFKNVEKLDKIPKDPLTDRNYTYSVINTKQEYQLAGVMEGDEVTSILNQTNALEKTAMLKISGNYNGKLLKVSTGGTDYVLAVPSIITSSGFTLEQIIANKLLAYNGYKNLPAQYVGSSYKLLGEDGLTLVNNNDLIIYSGDLKTLSDTTSIGITARKNLVTNLQKAYIGTAITNIGEISQIMNTVLTDTDSVRLLSVTLVNNNLGGNISGGGNEPLVNSCDEETKPDDNGHITYITNPISAGQTYVKDGTECGFTCKDWYTGTNCENAPTDYPGCSSPDITKGTITIAACNVGTNLAGTTLDSYGHYFQFGTNSSFEEGMWVNGSVSFSNDWKSPGGTNTGSANDWGVLDVNKITATYNNSDLASQILMKGPCATGYHVPTKKEWVDLVAAGGWGTSGVSMSSALKLPMAGRLYWDTANLTNQGGNGFYWFASPNASNGSYLTFAVTTLNSTLSFNRSYGLSIRCFKN